MSLNYARRAVMFINVILKRVNAFIQSLGQAGQTPKPRLTLDSRVKAPKCAIERALTHDTT